MPTPKPRMPKTRRGRLSRREYAILVRCQEWGVDYKRVRRADVFKRDKWICKLCDEPIDKTKRFPNPGSPSIDHIVPISRGGNHEYRNVQAAHLRCNILKSNKHEE